MLGRLKMNQKEILEIKSIISNGPNLETGHMNGDVFLQWNTLQQ